MSKDIPEDLLRYDKMVEKALRNVVREAIDAVAKRKTLPGEHHFFITFDTGHAGVSIPDYLRKQYPEEMTIVLQYQFYDLEVKDDILKVTLSFNNKLERLVVPLEAVTTFADPAVSFALQFQSAYDEDEEGFDGDGDDDAPGLSKKPERPAVPKGVAEVVTLDAFRKKQNKDQ
jgi:uncharacterized protein